MYNGGRIDGEMFALPLASESNANRKEGRGNLVNYLQCPRAWRPCG